MTRLKLDTLSKPKAFEGQLRENPWTRDSSQDLRSVDILDIPPPGYARARTDAEKRAILRQTKKETAAEMIGGFGKELQVDALTKGTFSLVDLISATLDKTGPSTLVVSSWTAANRDVEEFHRLVDQMAVQGVRWLIDMSFQRRRPVVAAQLRNLFGVEAIRVARIHAKFVLIHNEEWKVVLRTSMNLNSNPRMEFFSIQDDPTLFEFYLGIVDEIFRRKPRDERFGKEFTLKEG